MLCGFLAASDKYLLQIRGERMVAAVFCLHMTAEVYCQLSYTILPQGRWIVCAAIASCRKKQLNYARWSVGFAQRAFLASPSKIYRHRARHICGLCRQRSVSQNCCIVLAACIVSGLQHTYKLTFAYKYNGD